jgi:hypothetical protein
MSKRVIVGIEPKVEWDRLKRELGQAGAHSTSDPTSYQPDAVVATLPDSADAPAFIEHVKRLHGVRYAEPDGWASTGPLIKP